MAIDALREAITIARGQSALARLIGIRAQAVQQWVRQGRVPAERVLAVEAATGGRVSRTRLRPDLYPSATSEIRAPDEVAA